MTRYKGGAVSVAFVSDLHLGHRTILDHTAKVPGAYRGGTTVDEHDIWVIERMMALQPNKRTLWWILGDVAMDETKLTLLDAVPGRKRLILGNHDLFPTKVYLRHFEWVGGIVKKYDMWLTHAPLHPAELWGRRNVHGHAHHNTTADDPRYLNVSIELLPQGLPMTLEQIRALKGESDE